MRIERQLSPERAVFVRGILAQLIEQRRRYLLLMGEAAELSQRMAQDNRSLDTVLALVNAEEPLPPSAVPYTFSPDGSALIGESKGESYE